ncbi:MAG: DNA translocase FtsK 4TM domain-containing protein [Deltaproteobacteria bacterium]|nr:DNA translocase FtsK 4TM domain-containing protein [Deltaproteobacteria bacterium]
MANSREKKKGLKQEVIGIVLLAISLFAIISLLSYSATNIASNWGGVVGGYTARFLFKAVGYSAYLFPILIVILALEFLMRREFDFRPSIPISLFFFLLSFSGLLSSLIGSDTLSGGIAGKYLCLFLWDYLNWAGTLIVLAALFITSAIFATGISFVGVIGKGYNIYKQKSGVRTQGSEEKEEEETEKPIEQESEVRSQKIEVKPTDRPAIIVPPVHKKQPKQKEPAQEHFEFLKASGEFQLPPLSFLDSPPEKAQVLDEESLRTNSKILEKKLKDYGINGQVLAVTPGPVVTMYEFEPAAGVKVASIINLSDDLALALRAASIRIIAPIPGKAVVGIEVPNAAKQKIYLKEILESEAYTKSHSKLTFALGKDISGASVAADLAKMPHLLMAGSTGAGKSVTVNGIIISILYKATPVDVRFLMIDPKMLELSAYEGIPHLLTPVVTDAKRAVMVLRGMVNEMGERYKLMAEKGTKGIDKYNQLFDEAKQNGTPANEREVSHRRLPHIVVVIDELSDLMIASGKDVEESLVRLSQMARAAGIHLLVATQRPSVDVITGLIKANFPARISLQFASRTDSRTILDTGGAETLLGEGDMLFLPPGSSRLKRIHGAYISESEIKRVTDFLKKQGKPTYDKAISEAKVEEKEYGDDDLGEEFNKRYDEAVALVAQLEYASTSYLQRRLRIGYNTAARIIEKMEAEGIVGPAQGSRPREVLVKQEGGVSE